MFLYKGDDAAVSRGQQVIAELLRNNKMMKLVSVEHSILLQHTHAQERPPHWWMMHPHAVARQVCDYVTTVLCFYKL